MLAYCRISQIIGVLYESLNSAMLPVLVHDDTMTDAKDVRSLVDNLIHESNPPCLAQYASLPLMARLAT